MRRSTLLIVLMLLSRSVHAQVVDITRPVTRNNAVTTSSAEKEKGRWFGKGLLDMNVGEDIAGSAQANAEMLRFYIGEPRGFRVPLYFLIGVEGTGLKGKDTNLIDYASLITPHAGLLNIAFNDNESIVIGKFGSDTKLLAAYHAGVKGVSGTDTSGDGSAFAWSMYGDLGLFFHTPALYDDADRTNAPQTGQFWLQAKLYVSFYGLENSKKFFGAIYPKDISGGFSVSAGLFVTDVINAKLLVVKPTNQSNKVFSKPIIRFAIDYSLRK